MRKGYIYRLLTILCFASISTIVHADEEQVCISLPFAKTILLDEGEQYHKGMSDNPTFKYGTCTLTLVDSSFSIVDTLCGTALYLLYFDTTKMADGLELQRTKDSLWVMRGLNRDVGSYRIDKVPGSSREIIVADSLIKAALRTKHIWMDRYTPYYAPYHLLTVYFTIIPVRKDLGKHEHVKSHSSFIMENFHVSEAAVRSGLYMTNLTDKETIAQCLYDLLCIYERKTGFYSNKFVRKCYTLGLKYHYPDILHSKRINDLKYQLDKKAWLQGFRSDAEIREDSLLSAELNYIQQQIMDFEAMGYHAYTPEEYMQKYKETIDYLQRENSK